MDVWKQRLADCRAESLPLVACINNVCASNARKMHVHGRQRARRHTRYRPATVPATVDTVGFSVCRCGRKNKRAAIRTPSFGTADKEAWTPWLHSFDDERICWTCNDAPIDAVRSQHDRVCASACEGADKVSFCFALRYLQQHWRYQAQSMLLRAS